MQRNILLVFILVLLTALAQAAGGEHGVPWSKLILPQTVNFTIFIVALYFLVKAPVSQFFSERKNQFERAEQDAQKAKLEAQSLYDELKAKISDVEARGKKDLAQATIDAKEAGEKIILEAKTVAKRLENEAKSTAQQELYRAVSALKTEFLSNAFSEAEQKVKSAADSSTDTRLQAEFVSRAKQVRP